MTWNGCKNILCIRPDNMGDLIMTVPAIRALKETFNAKITILTSSMAAGICKHIPEIDEVMIFDVPWVKSQNTSDSIDFIVKALKEKSFDAAVVFTVFSQNPLPTAMLAYMAGIPRILAYCRENPYQLINYWLPENEPYDTIRHQVERDLALVASVGAITENDSLSLHIDDAVWRSVNEKAKKTGIDMRKPWLVLHAGVSEKKREYPVDNWVDAGKKLVNEGGFQLLLTGSASEKYLTDEIAAGIGNGAFSVAGLFMLDEFICLIKHAPLLISVNTGTIHIAAATQTPVVVLYAQTNPQHTPWKVPCRVLPFSVPAHLQSKNQVVAYLNKTLYSKQLPSPTADEIYEAVCGLL